MNEKLNLQAPDLWYSAAFEAYPAVIAHEYWRLYDLLENKQVYGALLQIKDLFEVILKLPVLVYAAHLYRKERAPGENRLLLALLDQLSLGTWLGIGRQMYNQLELPDAASDINEHLKAVLDLFEKHKIVSWRNDVIGHGALSLNEAHDLESDIASLLRALRDFFQTQDQLYQTLVLRLQNAETYKSESDITDGILRGRAGARSLHRKEDDSGDPTERERLSVEYQDFHIELYPFAFVQAGDIFFFDGFILRKDKSDIISYPPGYRRSEHLPEILDLTQSVRRQEQDAALGGGYSGNTYLAENRKVIESIFTVEDFRKPVYLMDWLRESVLKQTGGVFHLQMEMGTGKSTFARALDETRRTGNMKIDFKNLTVRGYFLNDSYLASVQAFCNSINDFFNRDKHGDRTFESQETDLPNVQSGSETPREDVAALLNFYRDRYEWHYGTTRLLFIIDGLAEIPADQSRSIMDFIPTRDLLNDGVFVLLTSRPVYELPAHVRDAAILQPDNITGAKTIDRNDAEYQCVLSEYAQKEILEPLQLADRVQPDMLMHKSEFRFLYMRLYRELLKSYGDNLPSSLPEGALLLEQYLERLRKLYGDKFYQHLSTLLAILASAYEPLTLAEIAYLSGRDEPDFKMLAYLADLRGFFKTERSYRGNLISLHQEWKEGARSLLDETIRMLVRQWIDDCLSLPKEKLNAENDGMTYLFSYLHEYAENYCKVAKLAADTGIRLLTAFERFSGNDQQIYLLQRQRRITESALGVFTDSGENSMLFAKAEEYRGDVEFSLKEKLHGHGFYSSAILHLNQLPESDRQDCRGQLLQLFSKRASAALNIKTYRQHAIEDCDRAIQLFNELKADGCKLDVFSLVKIYSDRSTACVFEARYEDAASDCDFTIQLLEETSSDKNENQHVSSLARLFLNRGRARYHSGQLSEAYDDCSEAIRLIEKSQAVRFLNEALFLKGSICFKLGDVEHAIGAYSLAIEQFEDMQRKGHVVDEISFCDVLSARSEAHARIANFQDAFLDISSAIDRRARLRAQGRLSSGISSLWQDILLRGKLYMQQKKYEMALLDFEYASEVNPGSGEYEAAKALAEMGEYTRAVFKLEGIRSRQSVEKEELLAQQEFRNLRAHSGWNKLVQNWNNPEEFSIESLIENMNEAGSYISLGVKLLRDAATFFRNVGGQNPGIHDTMMENADVYENVADMVEKNPQALIPLTEGLPDNVRLHMQQIAGDREQATFLDLTRKLLMNAASFFEDIGQQNEPLKAQMLENSDVYDQVQEYLDFKGHAYAFWKWAFEKRSVDVAGMVLRLQANIIRQTLRRMRSDNRAGRLKLLGCAVVLEEMAATVYECSPEDLLRPLGPANSGSHLDTTVGLLYDVSQFDGNLSDFASDPQQAGLYSEIASLAVSVANATRKSPFERLHSEADATQNIPPEFRDEMVVLDKNEGFTLGFHYRAIQVLKNLGNSRSQLYSGYLGIVYTSLGLWYYRNESHAEAIDYLTRAIEAFETVPEEMRAKLFEAIVETFYLRGRILLVEMDAVDEALRDFHECVRGLNNEKLIRQYLQSNRLLDHLYLCGIRLQLQSELQEALPCYNMIIELLSNRVDFLTYDQLDNLACVYHFRGQVYLESESDSDAAIQDFNHACSIYDEMEDAMTPEYWNNLAGVLRSRGNYYASVDSPEDAKENHAKSLEIRKRLRNQDYPDIEIHLAESLDAYGLGLLLNGKIEESLIYFEQASSTVPGHSTYNLACAHARLGNLNTAFDFLEQNRDSDFKQPREHVEQDTDLTSLHSDPRWSQLLKNWDKTE